MKNSCISALMIGLLVSVGCSDRGDRTELPPAGTATAPEAAAPPPAEAPSAKAPLTEGARATTGTRQSSRPASQPQARTRPATRPADSAYTAPREHAPAANPINAAPARRAAEWREVTIPAGTALPLELETALSSETATVEMPVRARLRDGIVVDGFTVLPAGAILMGEVTDVERAGRVKGRASLAFSFNRVQANNLREDLRTNPLTYVGEASKGEDATKIGGGAVGGAIIGGILGGKKGAGKGAVIGGAAGTGVVLATRGKEVELGSGADLAASLATPLTIRVPIR